MAKEYMNRICDQVLQDKLEAKGAVLIKGAKWCGKTTTAEHVARSVIYMEDPAKKQQYLQMADINPSQLLKGEVPRLIDEWQLAPKLWDAVRFEVDQRDDFGQFILTGSAVPPESAQISHTGTGRITSLTMRTMSLFESGDSDGSVSLRALFSSEHNISGSCDHTLNDIAFLICRGGWPKSIGKSKKVALAQAPDYLDAVIESDISRVDGINRNEQRVRLLMRSYARNQGAQVSNAALKADMDANDSQTLDEDTVLSYVNALKKIFVVEDLPAWNPNLRSKTVVRTSDTRYFVDPSIATAALGIYPKDLMNDLNTFGLMFETMCIRDLRIYADALGGQLYHYRDKSGLECDAVIHLNNGDYGLIEIKLGGNTLIEHGAKTMKELADKIDTTRMQEPSFLMVLSGTDSYAYQRKDGVYVVPIGCLKD